jgi:hypothetical protein
LSFIFIFDVGRILRLCRRAVRKGSAFPRVITNRYGG